MANKTKIAAHL